MTTKPVGDAETSDAAQAGRALRAFSATYFVVLLGYSAWRMTFYNYALDTFQLSPTQIGNLLAIASVPGALAIVVAILEHRLSFRTVTIIATALLGGGLILLGSTSQEAVLMLGVLLVSAGVAWFLPLANKIVIREHGVAGVSQALGKLKSLGPAAAITAAGLVYLAVRDADTIAAFLIATGVLTLASGFWCAFRSRDVERDLESLQLRLSKRLWVYYLLNFLAGSRSAIFKTFVISQFVLVYHLDPGMMSMTILAGSFASLLGYRFIGYLGSTREPATVLAGLYLLVACSFTGFAVVDTLRFFVALFLLDALLFGSATLTDAHLKRVSEPERLTGDLSVGLSFFHVAGVIVPPLIGWLWSESGALPAALLGTVVCAVAMGASLLLRRSTLTPA